MMYTSDDDFHCFNLIESCWVQ